MEWLMKSEEGTYNHILLRRVLCLQICNDEALIHGIGQTSEASQNEERKISHGKSARCLGIEEYVIAVPNLRKGVKRKGNFFRTIWYGKGKPKQDGPFNKSNAEV